MASDLLAIEKSLWATADQLWANTGLKPAEFSTPVLGLIFLRYADKRFTEQTAGLIKDGHDPTEIDAVDYHADGVLFLPETARFSHLLKLPEGANRGRAINDAMEQVEAHNPELKGVLPRNFNELPERTLVELLRVLEPLALEGDAFGKVYEYFLGNFALKEGQKGGVFYTPTSIVRLIVEILEPYHGRIFDPACGSGGMFVQSADFVKRHQRSAASEITVFGTEKSAETVKLAKMNLAVHGLSGDVREANTYYEDPHKALGRFDFVMANPPFNVSGVDKDRLKDDKRFALGRPSTDNANYLWIQLFYNALNETGRAGFVMANSAGDARGSESEIRKKLIESGAVDVIINVGPNFFYTVTLPCTLWFFDKGKRQGARKDTVLFIDARPYFKQITRAIREFLPEQQEFLANVVRLYRGETTETVDGSETMMTVAFPNGTYQDVAGLCKAATRAEIESQAWSLNSGRYVGVSERAKDDFIFAERLEELHEELSGLNAAAMDLQNRIESSLATLLGKAT